MARFMAENDKFVWTIFVCFCLKFNNMMNVL